MKKIITLTAFLSFSFIYFSSAQVGDQFPELEGEVLEDDHLVLLPKDTKGKYTLLGLAYSKKSEKDLETWFEPIYLKFIRKPSNPTPFYTPYDVNLYFVPMFTGVNKLAAGTVKKKMYDHIDEELHSYILMYKGNLKDYKDALAFEKKDVPYFFVLDEDGKIVYATSGNYTSEKLDAIDELLSDDDW